MNEASYTAGSRTAWVRMLSHCLRELGYESPETKKAAWILEREAMVAALRHVCERRGDNDWPDDLNLADVFEKHLMRHIEGTAP